MIGSGIPKTVVVALDGSELSNNAIPVADRLADRFGAELVLTTSLADDGPPPSWLDEAARAATAKARSEVARAATAPEGIAAVLAGSVDPVLCMTTRGRSRLGTVVLGSVASEVVRTTAAPVVLVGPACDPDWPAADGPMLVCLDGSAASDAILPVAGVFAPALGVGAVVVHVCHPLDVVSVQEPNEVIERGEHALRPDVSDVRHLLLRSDYPTGALLDASVEVDASMVAMATHGRSGLARLVLGSVATGVVHASRVPVLVVRPPL